jgi:prepilin-type N-terminal cleavage/methylation domain-containing protein
MHRVKKQSGFTIIELLVATTIFSIVLMVILASFLQIGRMYYKGISVNNTQEAARSIIENLTNDIRLSSGYQDGGIYAGAHYFCLGLHRYIYNINHIPITSTDITNPTPTVPKGVVVSTIGGSCQSPAVSAGSKPQQLLGPDMQLNDMSVTPMAGMYRIHVHIIFYGSDKTVFNSTANPDDTAADHAAAINDPDARCSGNLLSTQFCAVADLNTTVATRE